MRKSRRPTHLLTLGHHVSFVGEPQRLNGPTRNSGLNKVWAHTKSSPARSSAYTGPPRIFRRRTTQVEWAYSEIWSKRNLGPCENLAGQPICSLWAITLVSAVSHTGRMGLHEPLVHTHFGPMRESGRGVAGRFIYSHWAATCFSAMNHPSRMEYLTWHRPGPTGTFRRYLLRGPHGTIGIITKMADAY
jgi:hypothetical protein